MGENGQIILRTTGSVEGKCNWSQMISIQGEQLRIRNEITFPEGSSILADNSPLSLHSFVQVAKTALDNKGKLRGSGGGFMLLPVKERNIMVRFHDGFERFHHGVYYIVSSGRCGIAPENFDETTVKADLSYVTEFEVEIY